MNIAWGVTGAGHYLKETFQVMEELSKTHSITTFLSESGEEVLKAYGMWDSLEKISPGSYLKEVITSHDAGASAPATGRFFLKRYDLLVVSPATANTVAKMAHGISDTLVTNAFSSACKCMTKVLVLPVDSRPGEVETTLPYFIDRGICVKCETCGAERVCPQQAVMGYSIDLLKCTACGECVKACEFEAVVAGKKARVKVREIDVENVEGLKKMEFVKVLNSPEEILTFG